MSPFRFSASVIPPPSRATSFAPAFFAFALALAFTFALTPLRAQDENAPDAPDSDAEAEAAEETGGGFSLYNPDMSSAVPWSLSAAAAGNSHYFGSSIELLAPLFFSLDQNHFGYLDLSVGAFDEGNQNYSVGAGYRRYIDALRGILGFNVFFDHKETRFENGFNGVGVGVEYKGPRFDFNAGYSGVEDDMKRAAGTQTWGAPFAAVNQILQGRFNVYEAALDGVYGEIGFLIPFPEEFDRFGELRIFGGGYNYYDNPFPGGDIAGAMARLEWRINNFLTIDLSYYDDEEIAGGESNIVGGFRASIPLGNPDAKPLYVRGGAPDGAHGEGDYLGSANPIGNGRENVRYRYSERPHRKYMLQTATSGSNFAPGFDTNVVVLDNVFFVNGPTPTGNGIAAGNPASAVATAEDPQTDPNLAALLANFAANPAGAPVDYIYTQGGGPIIVSDVGSGAGLFADTHFIGSGKLIPAFGGFFFGEGPAPVIDGGFAANGANGIADFAVIGYEIINGLSADSGGIANSFGDGVAIQDVTTSLVHDVMIDLAGTGNDGISNLTTAGTTDLTVSWSSVTGGIDFPIGVPPFFDFANGLENIATGGTANVTMTDFTTDMTGDDSLYFNYTGAAGGTIGGMGITITDAGAGTGSGSGIDFDAIATSGSVDATFTDLTITRAEDEGIDFTTVAASPAGVHSLTVTDAAITDVGLAAVDDGVTDEASGIEITAGGMSTITFAATDVTVTTPGEHGIELNNTGMATLGATLIRVDTSGTGAIDMSGAGDGLRIRSSSSMATTLMATDVTTDMSGNDGVSIALLNSPPGAGNMFTFTRLTATSSMDDGVDLSQVATIGMTTSAAYSFTDTTITTATTDDAFQFEASGAGTNGFDIDLTGSTFSGAGDDLISILVSGMTGMTASFDASDTTLTGAGDDGVDIQTVGLAGDAGPPVTVSFTDGLFIDMAADDAFDAIAFDDSDLDITVAANAGGARNSFTNSGVAGIFVGASGDGFLTASFTGLDIDTTVDGVLAVTDPGNGAAEGSIIDLTLTDVDITGVTADGVFAGIGNAIDSSLGLLTFTDLVITAPGDDGVDLLEGTGPSDIFWFPGDTTVTTPGGFSLNISGDPIDITASPTLLNLFDLFTITPIAAPIP